MVSTPSGSEASSLQRKSLPAVIPMDPSTQLLAALCVLSVAQHTRVSWKSTVHTDAGISPIGECLGDICHDEHLAMGNPA